mgnify:CR=1 FL=1
MTKPSRKPKSLGTTPLIGRLLSWLLDVPLPPKHELDEDERRRQIRHLLSRREGTSQALSRTPEGDVLKSSQTRSRKTEMPFSDF